MTELQGWIIIGLLGWGLISYWAETFIRRDKREEEFSLLVAFLQRIYDTVKESRL